MSTFLRLPAVLATVVATVLGVVLLIPTAASATIGPQNYTFKAYDVTQPIVPANPCEGGGFPKNIDQMKYVTATSTYGTTARVSNLPSVYPNTCAINTYRNVNISLSAYGNVALICSLNGWVKAAYRPSAYSSQLFIGYFPAGSMYASSVRAC